MARSKVLDTLNNHATSPFPLPVILVIHERPSVLKFRHGSYEPSPQGIQMNIADQLLEIGLLVTHDGFITVLKEMPMSAMAPIIGDGIAGEQAPHEGG